jgi:catechol 2,3-dioxygenase-like lactoylglutathione lyase family enzyme
MTEETWAKLVPELCVDDINATLKFYVEVLAFDMKYGRPEDGFAYLDKEGAQIMIEQVNEDRWLTGALEKPYGRGINFQIEIADVDTLYQKLLDLKYSLFMEIEEKWYRADDILTGSKQFLIQDPDGYLLRFFTHLGEKPVEE